MLMQYLLRDNWFLGLGIPVAFLFVGSLGKRLVRPETGPRREDFYFGVELVLAALSGALIHTYDLAGGGWDSPPGSAVAAIAVFITLTILGFMIILVLQKEYKNLPDENRKEQIFWLAGVSNLIGIGLLFTLVYVVPRG